MAGKGAQHDSPPQHAKRCCPPTEDVPLCTTNRAQMRACACTRPSPCCSPMSASHVPRGCGCPTGAVCKQRRARLRGAAGPSSRGASGGARVVWRGLASHAGRPPRGKQGAEEEGARPAGACLQARCACAQAHLGRCRAMAGRCVSVPIPYVCMHLASVHCTRVHA